MVDITRRGALGILAAAAVNPATAFAAGSKDSVKDFYLTVTKQAFDKTYGTKLSPDSIADSNDLRDVLRGTADTYRENYIQAVKKYFEGLSKSESDSLYKKLADRPEYNGRDNLLGAVNNDLNAYTRNGRAPTEGSTNPLYYALYKLHKEGKITDEDYYTGEKDNPGWLDKAISLTHGKKTFSPFTKQVMGAIEDVRKTMSAAPAVKAPEKTF